VALILDLAVLAIAAVVVGSLALLTWTFAVSIVHAVHRGRRQVATARAATADAEHRIRALGRRGLGQDHGATFGPEADADGDHTIR
jgi:hypothetical protein